MQNARGQTPLHMAVRYGDAASVHYLLTNGKSLSHASSIIINATGAKRGIVDRDGNNAVHLLSETFVEDIYKDVLCPPPDCESNTSDLTAVNNDGMSSERVKRRLSFSAGFTPVHMAVRRLKMSLLDAFIENCDGGVLLTPDGNTKCTPLHLAIKANDCDMAELILKV